MRRIRLLAGGTFAAVLLALPSAAAAEPDCVGPAGDPQPGTLEWQVRHSVLVA